LEALLSTLIVVGLVMGLRIAGAILMIGILVAPPVAARQWTQHLGVMVVVSGLIGAFSGMSGAYISGLNAAFPTGPFIILVAFIIAVISILIAPQRGLLWRWWNRSSDRHRFAGRQVMRDLYHTLSDPQAVPAVPAADLESLRGSRALIGLKHLERQGLAERCMACEHFQSGECPGCWVLTNQGWEMAQHDAHNRRLWMCYRLHAHELGLPVIEEDDERDIRSLLSADAIGWLEERLDGNVDH
jgi:manganese/zinc/iron transport system permease protein